MSVRTRRDAAARRTVARRREHAPWFFLLATLALLCFGGGGAFAKGTPTCSKRRPCDTTPPAVAISVPSSGAVTTGTVTVTGTASDNSAVAKVSVTVDGTSPQLATGTTSWSDPLNTTTYVNGAHTITATATDSAGNVGTASVSVDVSNAIPSTPGVVTNAAASQNLVLLGSSRMAEQGSVSLLLYREQFSWRPWAYFKDASSGAYTNVPLLPAGATVSGWENAHWAWKGQNLFVFSGNGPVVARQYQLSGSPLPTSATLVSTTTFGDADSRVGDFIGLASGGYVGVWHQQGQLGPEGQGIAYRSPSGPGSSIYPLQFMQTRSSRQTIAQHPADGTIWAFSTCDACGEIGTIHLTEGPSALTVDWTNEAFINDYKYGDDGPDPELPDVVAAPDASTGTIALAYQSAHRTSVPCMGTAGSYLAVARVAADGGKSFLSLPGSVERISDIGLVVGPGETWLAYRQVDPATCTFDHLQASRYASGSWDPPLSFGQLAASSAPVGFGDGRADFAAALADGNLHYLSP